MWAASAPLSNNSEGHPIGFSLSFLEDEGESNVAIASAALETIPVSAYVCGRFNGKYLVAKRYVEKP